MSVFLTLLGFLLYKTYFKPNPPQAMVCPGAQNITVGFADKDVEVPLDPVCWSGWIQTPPSADLSLRNGHLALEMLFIKGERWNIGGPPKFMGQVPSSTFRLRGEGGKATIFLSRMQ